MLFAAQQQTSRGPRQAGQSSAAPARAAFVAVKTETTASATTVRPASAQIGHWLITELPIKPIRKTSTITDCGAQFLRDETPALPKAEYS